MIMKLLEIRTWILKAYQKARFIINPIVKFLLAMLVFGWINEAIGYDARFTGTTVKVLLSVICAVLPGGVTVFFAMVLSLIHVYSVSLFLAVLLLLAYIVLFGMLIRFAPKQALAAVAIPVLARFNLHYCVPMVLGCTATPLGILPCISGVFIYYMMEVIKAAATRQVEMTLDSVLQLYTDIADALIAHKQMYIAMIVFSLVIVVVFVIRQMTFDYAFMIAIGSGVLVSILGFLIGDLRFNVTVNVGTIIFMSLLSGVVAIVIEYMKRVLDFSAIEHVQFEDDDYYYYVKAVPKVNVTIPRHNVKRIDDDEDDDEDDDGYDDGYDDNDDDYGYDPEEGSGSDREDDAGYYDYRVSPDIDDGPYEGDESGSSDVRYEEFGDEDFGDDTDESYEDYSDEDLSEYGIQSVDDGYRTSGSSDAGAAAEDNPLEPLEYEIDMTLDDDK